LTAAQEAPRAQRVAGILAAVSYHAYVPPSFAYLPVAYQRDFVRGSLVEFQQRLPANMRSAFMRSQVLKSGPPYR